MIVFLIGSIGSNDRGRREHQLEGCRGGSKGRLQPSLLVTSENRFFRAIFYSIGTPIISAFQQPDLHILAPSYGVISWIAGGKLLLIEKMDTLLEGDRAILLPGPTIVFESIMIILDEVGRMLRIKGSIARHGKKSRPLEAHELHRPSPWFGLVVIFDVSGVHHKVWMH